jgi:flagellar biosynthesis anti-sigma factor FlgM
VNTISKPQTQPVFESPKPASASGRPAQTSGVSADQVDLTSQNGLLSQVQSSGADSRAARLEQLRALIQSGQYEVDTHALSGAIVTSTLNGY